MASHLPRTPYFTAEIAPGHLRHQTDYAASRAIAADMEARERARMEAAAPAWKRAIRSITRRISA